MTIWRAIKNGRHRGKMPMNNKEYEILKQQKAAIIEAASAKQRQAADPLRSVWVSASAGTGKTRILTNRVLRLLLTDVLPHRILCLTFTNAAASEMNNRIQDDLAKWANLDEPSLEKELLDLLGRSPSSEEMRKAKRLFAKTIESPGGLRILTIHGFCQQILGRFPVEAGIPPNFSVVEPIRSEELLVEARNEVMHRVARGALGQNEYTPLTEAVNILLKDNSEYSLTSLLNNTRFYRQEILDLITDYSYDDISKIYARYLEAPLVDDLPQLYRDYLIKLSHRSAQIKAIMGAFAQYGSANEQNLAIGLDEFLAYPDKQIENFTLYTAPFLKADNQPRLLTRYPTKAVKNNAPDIENYIETEQLYLAGLFEAEARIKAYNNSMALTRFSGEVLREWQYNKLSHMLLDYDDLIERTSALLKNNMSWVHYKLDEGIDHILVDEAQDTSPKQWKIIWRLAKEFFEDIERNNHKNRTLFVVGDFKQSIYSFQGAIPKEFIEYQKLFTGKAAEAGIEILDVQLDTNFRSIPPILQFTDMVINQSAKQGVILPLSEKPLHHQPVRLGDYGDVEIWPLLPKQKSEDFTYSFPPSLPNDGSNEEKLAENVAARIRQLLDEQFYVSSQKRPCMEKDFLILVRKRNPIVAPLIKALNAHNIPVFGADRLDILEQIAVQDLLALARFMLQPADDYSLACILRSPLFDVSEADLFDLSFERETTLFTELKNKQNENIAFKHAYEILDHWRGFVDFRAPFAFFSQILAEKEYERMIIRLGGEAKDALHEFLEFTLAWEKNNPPLLETFMRTIDSGKLEVKREYENDETSNAIRIMTVHGSKGLQAPIVILPECENNRKRAGDKIQLYHCRRDETIFDGLDIRHPIAKQDAIMERIPLLFWTKGTLPDAMRQANEQNNIENIEEYHRLLYVALTRAEDKLIIGGIQQSENKSSERPLSWYDHILAVTQNENNHFVSSPTLLPYLEGDIKELKATYDMRPQEKTTQGEILKSALPLPDYFYDDAPIERRPYNPLTPGQVMDEDSDIAARSPLDNTDLSKFFNRGIIIHKLLELLPQSNKDNWEKITQQFLQQKNWQLPHKQQADIFKEVMAVMHNPEFADIFDASALVEVPISGILGDDSISGRIDRLLIKENEILLIDFKTNRKPPMNAQSVANIYIKQLKTYKSLLQEIWPNKKIRCALLWTDNCTLMSMDTVL